MTLTCAADQTTAAGEVDITGTSASADYDVTVVPGKLSIAKRPVNFKVNDMTVKYGEKLPDTYDFEVSNLVNGATKSSIGAAVDVEVCNITKENLSGTYSLKIMKASVTDSNYAVNTTTDGTLTIQEAAAGSVENSSAIPGTIVSGFGASGNLVGSEILKITDLTDGTTDAEVKGELTLTIPVDVKYNGKQITVIHYVKAGKLTAENKEAETDIIDAYTNLTVSDGKVQIKVYSLSPFAVIVPKDTDTIDDIKPDNSNTIPKIESQKVNGAKTGDTSPVAGLIIAVVTAALVIIAVMVIMFKKRKNNK